MKGRSYIVAALLMFIISLAASAQRRPHPYPRPHPGPRPVPSYTHHCINGDLYMRNNFIHRFYDQRECLPALRDLANFGKFCDYATLYDYYGRFMYQFNMQFDCRRALLNRP